MYAYYFFQFSLGLRHFSRNDMELLLASEVEKSIDAPSVVDRTDVDCVINPYGKLRLVKTLYNAFIILFLYMF